VYRHYSFWRYFGSCLLVYSARLSEKKKARENVVREEKMKSRFISIMTLERKKFWTLPNTTTISFSPFLFFSLVIKFHRNRRKKRKGNQPSMCMWKWKNYWRRHCIVFLLHKITQTLNGTNNGSVYSSYISLSFSYVILIHSDKTSDSFFYYIYLYFILLPTRWATTTTSVVIIILPTYIFIFSFLRKRLKEKI